MRWRLLASMLALSFYLLSRPLQHTQQIQRVQQAQVEPAVWQPVGQGVEYREFYLAHPNHIYVIRMQRNNPNVILESSIAQGRLSGGLETVRDMAKRYDEALNYWDGQWGRRNQVVAAVNGFFYDTESGVPWNGQIQSAWYAKRFDERHSGSGIVWTLGRAIFIGGCVNHPDQKQAITFSGSSEALLFDGINIPRGENKLIIYTPQYDATTPLTKDGLEVLVELERPLMVLPESQGVTGVVRAVRDGQGGTPIPFDHVALSASGEARERLSALVAIGRRVAISQRIRHFESDCRTPAAQEWTEGYAAIGSSFHFLREGILAPLQEIGAVLRSPRTAIAFNEQYIFFIVVDGRDSFLSMGMSIVEVATFAKTYLGASYGAALDGGGSSTMVVNGELKNKPNTEVQSPSSGTGVRTETVERAVANGMMVVVVQPAEYSNRYRAGQNVSALTAGDVRLGPGSNYAAIAGVTPGQTGAVMAHALNGVYAKGAHWWKVAFGELVGWVSEEILGAP